MMLKLGDTIKLKTMKEITGGWIISPGSGMYVDGNEYTYEMSKWGGCIGRVILIASNSKVIVNFTGATDEISCCCHPNWVELQNRAGEVILSEEVMSLI